MKYGLRSAVCGLAMTVTVTAFSISSHAQQKADNRIWWQNKAKIEKTTEMQTPRLSASSNVRDSLLSRLDGVRIIFVGINHLRDFKRDWVASLIPRISGKVKITAVGFEELNFSLQDSLSAVSLERPTLPKNIEDNVRYVFPRTPLSDYSALYAMQNALDAKAQLIAMHPNPEQLPAPSYLMDGDEYSASWSAAMLELVLNYLKNNPGAVALVGTGEQHICYMANSADSAGLKSLSIQVWGADEKPLPEKEARGRTREFYREANENYSRFAPLLGQQSKELGADELFVGNETRQMSSWADAVIYTTDSKPKSKEWYLKRAKLRFRQDILP